MNWLLIRGLSREVRHWGEFPQLLREKFPDDRVFPLELAGLGKKNQSSIPTTIAGFTEDLRQEWLEFKNNISGPWSIISISLGGMVGLDWCARYPDEIHSLVTLNSSAGNLSLPYKRLQPSAMKVILKLFLFPHDPIEREKAILNLTLNLKSPSTELIKEYAQYSASITRKSFLCQIYAAGKFKIPKSITQPYLILASRGDQLASYQCSMKIGQHFKREVQLHEKAGHDLPLDDPGWVLNQIETFIEKTVN